MTDIKTILVANSRDEHNIIEWIIYHQLLGFDKILIFDHLSKYPLSNFLPGSIPNVEIIRVEEQREYLKMYLMSRGLIYAKTDSSLTHIMHIDLDEYVVLKKHQSINEFIREMGPGRPGISLNWICYGNNDLLYRSDNLIIEDFIDYIPQGAPHPDGYIPHLTKPIHRIDTLLDTVGSPHHFNYKDEKDGNVDVLGRPCKSSSSKPDLRMLEIAYIAHFVYQSREDLLIRKLARPRDDNGDYRFKNKFIVPERYFTVRDLFLVTNYAQRIRLLIDEYKFTQIQLDLKHGICPRLVEYSKLVEIKELDYPKQNDILEQLAMNQIIETRKYLGHAGITIKSQKKQKKMEKKQRHKDKKKEKDARKRLKKNRKATK